MKKIYCLLVSTLLLLGCKQEKKSGSTVIPTGAETATVECYRGILKNDTISMILSRKGNEISSGTLRYLFYEKDSNEGELSGQIKGDTLFATYTFMSEGAASVREVAFLKKGNTYIEGYGDVTDDNQGNITFKDVSQLRFDGKVILAPIPCD